MKNRSSYLHAVDSQPRVSVMELGNTVMIDQFCDTQRIAGMSPRTVKRRRQTLTQFEREAVPLTEATLDDIESWVGAREAAASRQAVLYDLRAFYVWAVARAKIAHNPTEAMGRIKVGKRMPRPVPPEMLALAIEEARPKLRVTIMLGAYAGLRVSEISELRWADVDFENSKLIVRAGKGDKDRAVQLSPVLATRLKYLKRRADGYVIGTKGPSVSSAIRHHFDRLGIDYRPHDLRAAFATELARQSNGNVVLVASQLGHASIATTQRYMKWLPDGADAISRLFTDDAA